MKNGEKFKTAEERANAFKTYCRSKKDCYKCSLKNPSGTVLCCLKWLDLEAAEEKPLPCPFCGGDVIVNRDAPEEWVSCHCGYSSKMMNRGCSIAAHNRVARALMEAKKEGAEK